MAGTTFFSDFNNSFSLIAFYAHLLISLEGTDHTSWLGYCITNLEIRGFGPARVTSTNDSIRQARLDIVPGFLPEEALLPACNSVFSLFRQKSSPYRHYWFGPELLALRFILSLRYTRLSRIRRPER